MQTRPLGLSAESLIGTTTNDNAAAGVVGEFITANASGVATTTGTTTNICQISLTPGDWDVFGEVSVSNGGNNLTFASASTSTTSGANGPAGSLWQYSGPAIATMTCPVPTVRMSLSVTTTVYLVGGGIYSTGTTTLQGVLNARRAR